MALDAFHDARRVTAAVGGEHGKAAPTLNQRGEVCLPVLHLERDKVAFPVAELGSLGDLWWRAAKV